MISEIYFITANLVLLAEIKIVTIVDLLTMVSGVPSLYSISLSRFENFYSDV